MKERAPFDLLNLHGRAPLVLTCEHASYDVPEAYANLGINEADIRRHIGWDIGARWVVETLARILDAPAVCSSYSRLLIDCNRDVNDHDLIVSHSDGTHVRGNLQLSDQEREKRLREFYQPYHEAIDHVLRQRAAREGQETVLLSIHSFTPVLGAKERPFDLGVLFDQYEDLAQEMGQRLHHQEYRVRYNEPYSGLDGLIFSARSHGERHGVTYLELEINNGLIAHPAQARQVGERLGTVLQALFSPARESGEA
jgi:predicted N-formylglutamate amidohydrolase